MPHIYKITSPTGKIYIGSSTNLMRRIRMYKGLHTNRQPRLYASLKKYGWEAHIFEILEECSQQDMLNREAYHGAILDVLGENGLNCSLPKLGDVYVSKSQYTRDKMSRSRKGIIHSEATRKKLSEANKGKPYTAERCANMSKGRKGKPVSKETRAILSKANKGKIPWIKGRRKNKLTGQWEKAEESGK